MDVTATVSEERLLPSEPQVTKDYRSNTTSTQGNAPSAVRADREDETIVIDFGGAAETNKRRRQ